MDDSEFMFLLFVGSSVISLASMWKIFEKAGEPGVTAIIPLYNTYKFLRIVGRPGWWVILFFIPVLNIVIHFIVLRELSLRFGKGVGWTIGFFLAPFMFLPLLAVGPAEYQPLPGSRKWNPRADNSRSSFR